VRVHVSAMFAQLGVNSRTAAVLAAQQAGLVTMA
jgi:DNA-binding NarL/FixJ family response regulator